MVNVRPVLSNGETFHFYNRSVAKQSIFSKQEHLSKIISLINYYRCPQLLRYSKFRLLSPSGQAERLNKSNPYVSIYAYSFMPNHYHFMMKQEESKGASTFMSFLQNSYAKWFNTKYHRTGSLFQNNFKAVRVKTEEQFNHLSRYIHLNHTTSQLMTFEELRSTPFTSFATYLGIRKNVFLDTAPILNHFGSSHNYESFVKNRVEYQQTLKAVKDLTLEPI